MEVDQEIEPRVLTVDSGGGCSGLSDARLELDLQPVVLRELLVPLLAAHGDPLGEGLTDEGVDDVDDVLARHLADLPDAGEAVDDLRVGEAEVEDEVELEVLVEGNGDVLDQLAEDRLQKVRMRRGNLPFCPPQLGPSCARWSQFGSRAGRPWPRRSESDRPRPWSRTWPRSC